MIFTVTLILSMSIMLLFALVKMADWAVHQEAVDGLFSLAVFLSGFVIITYIGVLFRIAGPIYRWFSGG